MAHLLVLSEMTLHVRRIDQKSTDLLGSLSIPEFLCDITSIKHLDLSGAFYSVCYFATYCLFVLGENSYMYRNESHQPRVS